MKIKSLEKLEDQIDRDFAWRKMELAQINLAIKNPKNSMGINRKTLVRSGITLLYAHWEGFIRNIANYYIVYICHQRIRHKYLKENFITFKLYHELKMVRNSPKKSVHTALIKEIANIKNQEFFIKYSDKKGERFINTESNLNYELFCEILESLGFENKFTTKEKYIDNVLLSYRHEIAHGEFDRKDQYDFEDIYTNILSIMEEFKSQIISAASQKEYLKPIDLIV